jgi:uncharacterized protein with PIN domain
MSSPDPYSRVSHEIEIRFYAELNDFLPPGHRQRAFSYAFHGTPSVKDTIEAIGVPHTEVDVILVDDRSVGFDHLLQGGERVAVYPVFERYDVSPLTRLRPVPLRVTRFVADVHLGSLARNLRLLGFDTTWERDLADEEIVEIACDEQRIILTRDKGILKNGRVTHGYWLRSTDPLRQLDEVVQAIDLARDIEPYTRCMECNGELQPADRSAVVHSVPLQVFLVYREFKQCRRCHRVYWRGSHLKRLDKIVERARNVASLERPSQAHDGHS